MPAVVTDSPPSHAGQISTFGLSKFVPPSAPGLIRCAESLWFKLATQIFGTDVQKYRERKPRYKPRQAYLFRGTANPDPQIKLQHVLFHFKDT